MLVLACGHTVTRREQEQEHARCDYCTMNDLVASYDSLTAIDQDATRK